MGGFITGRADEQLTNLQNNISGLVYTPGNTPATITTLSYSPGSSTPTTSQTTLTAQQGDLILAQAAADRAYIGAAVNAGNAFGSSLQSARGSLRSTMLNLSESVRSAQNQAQLGYTNASANYIQSVDSTIENSLFEFSNASIGADQLRDTQSNTAWGGAMQGLVSAEGASQSSQSTATKTWTRGIATAYQAGAAGGAFFNVVASPYGSGANPVSNLLLTAATDDDAEIDHETIAGLIPNHPNNTDGTSGGTLPDPVQAGTDFHNAANTADDALDQANADAEDDRVAAVTGVRDGLGSGLETADVTWGGTMDTAGAALGSALDGIQDFDWQHVRNYVGAVTGARRAAELGALNAYTSYASIRASAMNVAVVSVTGAAVTRVTAYVQASADYYVSNADREADEAEATALATGTSADQAIAVAKRSKADAFATFSSSYVTYLTNEAGAAATTAIANVTTQNATALSEMNADLVTATAGINTYYDGKVADAQNAPPMDVDGDGVTDLAEPTATASLAALINAANTANTTSRTNVRNAFAESITPRTTSATNTFTPPPATSTGTSTTGQATNTAFENQQSTGTPPESGGQAYIGGVESGMRGMVSGFFARLTGQPFPAPEVATEEAEDTGSLLVFNVDGTVNWEKSQLTDEEKSRVKWRIRRIYVTLSTDSARQALESEGYFGIPIHRQQRAHHSIIAGGKGALVANAGDMAPEFEQHRQDHIKNDPLVIGYFGSIIIPFEDMTIAGSGHDLGGNPQSMEQIILSTGSVAATAIGAAGSLDVPGTGMLDEAGEATDAGRTVARVEGAVDEALGAVDAMEDLRRVSGRGRMGGLIARGGELQSLMNEAKSLKIAVETNNALLEKIGKAAAFDYSSGKIIIRSDATELEIFHELQHAKQWVALGRDPKAYAAADVFAREFHVYRQIMDNKARWSPKELSEATRYITDLFKDYLDRMRGQ